MIFPLIGNGRVKSSVTNFLLSGKIPHAILIAGDSGTGKHTLARFIAKAAVCTGENVPCENCHGCKMANALSHPDIISVTREDGKREMSVGIIRNTRADAFIKPHEAERKVYIIEDADTMNVNAQNALLKVLEEPPESVIFILLSRSRASLLPTVISRCTTLSLTPPPISDGVELLSENGICDREKAEELLTALHGNIGLAENQLKKSGKTFMSDKTKEFISLAFSGDGYKMLKLLSDSLKDRITADSFFSELKITAANELKTLPKSGKRAKLLFYLYDATGGYIENLKANANLPLLYCKIVADINEFRG